MKIIVGMSGGVDSSVSALLLKQKGYEVIGATMKLLNDEKTTNSINDAKKVCDLLNIQHYVFDFSEDFKNIIIKDFINNYKLGLTPNPCVVCNKFFKFDKFYEEAKKLGADKIATGHYVIVKDGKMYLSESTSKDQTYFLWAINKNILNNIVFPLGNYKSKDEIRKIASDNNLFVANKKDSQDICFIDTNYTEFLEKNLDKLPDSGDIVNTDGIILGKHKGLIYFTIGQRKGINVTSKYPLYVLGFNTEKNQLIVGNNEELYSDTLIAKNINILVDNMPTNVLVKIRSRAELVEAKLDIKDDYIIVRFKEKQRAITPGQSAVFYKDSICLGGGIIEKY